MRGPHFQPSGHTSSTQVYLLIRPCERSGSRRVGYTLQIDLRMKRNMSSPRGDFLSGSAARELKVSTDVATPYCAARISPRRHFRGPAVGPLRDRRKNSSRQLLAAYILGLKSTALRLRWAKPA